MFVCFGLCVGRVNSRGRNSPSLDILVRGAAHVAAERSIISSCDVSPCSVHVRPCVDTSQKRHHATSNLTLQLGADSKKTFPNTESRSSAHYFSRISRSRWSKRYTGFASPADHIRSRSFWNTSLTSHSSLSARSSHRHREVVCPELKLIHLHCSLRAKFHTLSDVISRLLFFFTLSLTLADSLAFILWHLVQLHLSLFLLPCASSDKRKCSTP